MKVRQAIERLLEMDPEATVLTPRDGFSIEVDFIEPLEGSQIFCEVAHGRWQRCWVEETTCDRNQIQGVLLI